MSQKKNSNQSGINKNVKSVKKSATEKEKLAASGLGGVCLNEPIPNLIIADNENVIEGPNNSSIVLGRDRPNSLSSGYGGEGHSGAGAIDIVVGRKGTSRQYTNPDFFSDAARIHISQKSDVDSNFRIVNGSLGPSVAKSSIALKADAIRIVGREGIKLVTKTDGVNSHNSDIMQNNGIDLIANNDDTDLQPIPKGENLSEALDYLTDLVSELSGIVNAFYMLQSAYNGTVATHYHYSPFYGITMPPSDTLMIQGPITKANGTNDVFMGLQSFKMNLTNFKNTYLANHGDRYINSKFNKVN